MPPAYEVLLLNTAIPQIQAAQSGDTYVVPRDIAFSTVANLANGTNLLPSLTFSSDTNTGIYREGADALGFTAGGGTNQMVLTSTGLGIGTNNPAQRLDVSSASTVDTDLKYNMVVRSTDAYTTTPQAGIAFATAFNTTQNLPLCGIYGGKENATFDDFASKISFATRSNGGNILERMRLSSDGTFRVKGAGTAGSTDAVQFSGSAPASVMTLDASGNLLVGTTNTDPTFNRVNGNVIRFNAGLLIRQPSGYSDWGIDASTGTVVYFYSDNGSSRVTAGSITVNGSSAAYNTSSDYRLKDNQQPLTGSGAFIDALKPKTWDWKSGGKGVGFIAHEVAEVSPGTVVGTKDAVDEEGKPIMQAMEYGSAEFIANIIAELQSLRARVAQLEQGA